MTFSPVQERNLKIIVTALVVLPLLAVGTAIYLLWNTYVFASDMVLLGIFFMFAQVGITIGYHRMLTHQGFDAPQWLRALFLILGMTAFEGSPAQWTATHIKHHAHSDEEDDPHSPLAGFWHAHMGWLYQPKSYAPVAEYAPHLLNDRLVMFFDRWWGVFAIASAVIPFAIGGWTGFVWGAGVRVFLNTHITYSVNSICHTFGKRDFHTTDESRNNWVVGLLAFGEGWHNNHHAFPRSAFHGMKWWQFDMSGIIIHVLERVGLVWNVQRISHETQEAQQVRSRLGVPALQELRAQLLAHVQHVDKQIQSRLESRMSDILSHDDPERLQRAAQRVTDIHATVLRATNLKKVRLQRYMKEVQELAASCTLTLATEKAPTA